MKVHNYHPLSRVYLGSNDADLDELETEVQAQEGGSGEQVWMLPAHATFIEPPPIPQGMVAVFGDDNTWQLVSAQEAPQEDGSPAPTFEHQQAGFMRWVDAAVDATYAAVIGNRAQEYLIAEEEARAYIEAYQDWKVDEGGPAPAVPESVQADVEAYDRTPHEAAQMIVHMADMWHAARVALRKARLRAKAAAMKTANAQDLAGVADVWTAELQSIREKLVV